jgi:hypothetical protein
MNSSTKPGWFSKKFWAMGLGLLTLILLAYWKADGSAYTAAGLIVGLYCGGQAGVDMIHGRSGSS